MNITNIKNVLMSLFIDLPIMFIFFPIVAVIAIFLYVPRKTLQYLSGRPWKDDIDELFKKDHDNA